jgi:pimeloyl-ACP methyl ester carboxylesterase
VAALRKMLVTLLILLLSFGREGTLLSQPRSCEESRPGIVIVVGGVGGFDILALSAQHALPKAGVRHEIREFAWSHGFGKVFKDLQDSRHLVRKAEELAELIRQLRAADPERPIYLVAKSGGTGLVLLAAELVPAGSMERVILLSAAVSPRYDLRRALRACNKEIVSFYSRHDHFILNWGTRQFGTIDRVYGPSAGLLGFDVPDDLNPEDRALYSRLVQIPWNSRMIRQGHTGTHTGTSLPGFLAAEVAPWLR